MEQINFKRKTRKTSELLIPLITDDRRRAVRTRMTTTARTNEHIERFPPNITNFLTSRPKLILHDTIVYIYLHIHKSIYKCSIFSLKCMILLHKYNTFL